MFIHIILDNQKIIMSNIRKQSKGNFQYYIDILVQKYGTVSDK